MERLVVFYFAVLIACAICVEISRAYNVVESPDKKEQKEASMLWSGPRIGRRKRNPVGSYPSDEDDQKLRDILNSLDEYPWTILSVDGDKRSLSFTPRLGRTLEENFVPRLGRTLENNFVPRLGRDLDDIFEERSVGKHFFSPRLGRMLL